MNSFNCKAVIGALINRDIVIVFCDSINIRDISIINSLLFIIRNDLKKGVNHS